MASKLRNNGGWHVCKCRRWNGGGKAAANKFWPSCAVLGAVSVIHQHPHKQRRGYIPRNRILFRWKDPLAPWYYPPLD